MTEKDFDAKPALQKFLEEAIAILGMEQVKSSDPQTVRLLLTLYLQGKTPSQATSYFKFIREARDTTNFEASLSDARNSLANHAYVTEQKVRTISESITESMTHDGPVTGVLNLSYRAQGLFRLKGLLDTYRSFAALLDIVYDSTSSAEIALAVVKEDAVFQLIEMAEAPPNDEAAGVVEALKTVIKILTNTL